MSMPGNPRGTRENRQRSVHRQGAESYQKTVGGLGEEEYCSIPDDLSMKYHDMFYNPEYFVIHNE